MWFKNKLFWMAVLAFVVRLLVGVSLHRGLPLYGHSNSQDDLAGYIFTDARIRDEQAWKLAVSGRPLADAFSRQFSSDQYGGLLAFSAWVYRYLSPDAQRPLLLIFFSALAAALGVPFLWQAVEHLFGRSAAFAATWLFALYPESVLLGSAAMREPYLLTFSAMAFWGFTAWRSAGLALSPSGPTRPALQSGWIWLALGVLGMLLVSPAAALAHLILFAGWVFFTGERRTLSWKPILLFASIFALGLFILSASLNRSGQFDASSPLHVVNDWLRLAVKWDIYQLERGSGWVQKLFDEMPEWMRLPFVAVYGIFQPVLPAAVFEPDNRLWQTIYILRAAGWYLLLPILILSFGAAAGQRSEKKRNLLLWLSLLTWTWILLSALRGGGDSWDNPRYRLILFVWQTALAGVVWVWQRETRNPWLGRVLWGEAVFLLVFSHWYASRYLHWGKQLPFAWMVGLIVAAWGIIAGVGAWRDARHNRQ